MARLYKPVSTQNHSPCWKSITESISPIDVSWQLCKQMKWN